MQGRFLASILQKSSKTLPKKSSFSHKNSLSCSIINNKCFYNQERNYITSIVTFEENKKDDNKVKPPTQNKQQQGERKPYFKRDNTQQQQNKSQQGEYKPRFNNQQQGGERKPYQKRDSTQQQQQQNKPKVENQQQTTINIPEVNDTLRTKEEFEAMMKEAQKIKELKKKLGEVPPEEKIQPTYTGGEGDEDNEETLSVAARLRKQQIAQQKEKQQYQMRVEGTLRKNGDKKTVKKKRTVTREKDENEKDEEEREVAPLIRIERKKNIAEDIEEDSDVTKVEMDLSPMVRTLIDKDTHGYDPILVAASMSKINRGLIPTFSEMGAQNGTNFAPLMQFMLQNAMFSDEKLCYLQSVINNYRLISRKVLENMQDTARAEELMNIYPFLSDPDISSSNIREEDVQNILERNPEYRNQLIMLFDPDFIVDYEAIEERNAYELAKLNTDGSLSSEKLEPYKQEIPIKKVAEKLLNHFNGKLYVVQLAGASGNLLQPETIKSIAQDSFDTIVRKRGSCTLQYLPEEEKNFIEEREKLLKLKFGLTRDNLYTFVSVQNSIAEGAFISLNARIEELLSKKRANELAVDNKFNLEEPSEEFDHEDEYYYGDESNPQEAKNNRTRAAKFLADFPGLPLKNHVSALRLRMKKRAFLVDQLVRNPKYESIPYIRDVPFSSGENHHAGKLGKYAKFAPIERYFDNIIETNSEPDSIARTILTNYSRALGQNDSIDMKTKLKVMHSLGAQVKQLNAEGNLMMPVAINPGKRTHFHANRVNPRDTEFDLLTAPTDINSPFYKQFLDTTDVIVKDLEKKTKTKKVPVKAPTPVAAPTKGKKK
ncbi:hypothetical protein ABK040_009385 [Willaertia magna]